MKNRRSLLNSAGLPALLLAACVLALTVPAAAQTLTIGQSSAPMSVDPHFYNGTPTKTLAAHIFDRLVEQTPDTRLVPGLALSWSAITDTTWEFRLRPNVRFTNGQPLTADDIQFSIERAPNVPHSPGGFGSVVRAIKRIEVVDPLTVRLHTDAPAPNLPSDLSNLAIISRAVGTGATNEDYNSGKAAIGTGAYKFVRFIPGDRVELVRNDDWWGPKPDWEKVTLRFLPNPGARSAALLAGDVDLIDAPSPNDLPKFQNDNRFGVYSRESTRLIFLAMDQSRAGASPFVTDKDGKAVEKNPLRDKRVREALSVAINRPVLAERAMQGTAIPAGQWMPRGGYSFNPEVKVPPYEPETAKRLLKEAGYPEGFKLTIHAPTDTRPTDPTTVQAIAQMWSRVGVATAVEVMPATVYNVRGSKLEFSASIWGWGSNSGESGYALVNAIGTRDAAKGIGSYNRGGYSNPKLDAMRDKALSTLDDDKREKLLNEAVAEAMDDVAVIPLYQTINYWIARKGVSYEASGHERNIAMQAKKTQ